MLEKIEINCQNCGAPINRRTMKCEYCGTEYKREHDGVPVCFALERPGVHRIRAAVRVDEGLIHSSPEKARDFAMNKLRQGIADGLLEYMKICTEKDYCSFSQIIHAEVRVVDPSFDY